MNLFVNNILINCFKVILNSYIQELGEATIVSREVSAPRFDAIARISSRSSLDRSGSIRSESRIQSIDRPRARGPPGLICGPVPNRSIRFALARSTRSSSKLTSN